MLALLFHWKVLDSFGDSLDRHILNLLLGNGLGNVACLVLDGVVVRHGFLAGNIFDPLDLLVIDYGTLHRHLVDVLARLVIDVGPLVRDILHSTFASHGTRR